MISHPIFIGGMPRSGTTLLRVMLDRHPHIACGPELRVIPALAGISAQTRHICGETLAAHYGVEAKQLDAAFHDLIASFLTPYLQMRGKKRIAEKTPANILHFRELERLFPNAHFIHIIRDGRDVVSSLLTMDWKDAATGAPMDITRDPAIAATSWAQQVTAGVNAKRDGQRIFEIRYEKLISEPREILEALFGFLKEPWSDDALTFHLNNQIHKGMAESSANQVAQPLSSQSIGRWRRDLSETAKAAVKKHAGDVLAKLDYVSGNDW